MNLECPRERDVVSAVVSGRWGAVDEDLSSHASTCATCGEVIAVASLLTTDREQSRSDVHVPAAGQVWWRAAVRARLEASQAATRPLTWLHGIAGACALGLTWAVAGTAWASIREFLGWFTTQTLGVDSRVSDVAVIVTSMMQRSLPLAFIVAACLVLAPLAVYFALSDD